LSNSYWLKFNKDFLWEQTPTLIAEKVTFVSVQRISHKFVNAKLGMLQAKRRNRSRNKCYNCHDWKKQMKSEKGQCVFSQEE